MEKNAGFPSIDKPWLKYYSVDAINAPLPQCTVYRNIYDANHDHLSEIALTYFDRKISYGKMFSEIDRCAGRLTALGLKQGDIISMCTAGTPETVYLMLAANKLGILANYINPLFSENEITARINETGCSILFVLDALYGRIEPVFQKLNAEKIVIIPVLQSAPFMVKTIGGLKKKTHINYSQRIEKWTEFISGEYAPYTEAPYVPDTGAIMVYSSGSTGASKGIVLTNDGINATIQNYDYGYDYVRGDIFLQMVPVWFSTGNVLSVLMPLQKGISVILEPVFSPEQLYKDMKKYHVGLTLVSTGLWVSLMRDPRSAGLNLAHMKYPITGGEQILEDTEAELNAFLKDRGCKYSLIKGYGMCEMGSTLTTSSRIHSKPGSVGYPILGKVTVAAFDMQTNAELKYGERGELRAITPAHMKEYFKNPAATAEFFRKGKDGNIWACTGDIGYVDSDGDVFILGRASDSYVSDAGNRIFLFDAENVILSDEAVSLCKVIDVNYQGKKVSAAHVVLKENSEETERDVIERLKKTCTEKLSSDEIPVLWKVRKSMPVHASGKRDVGALRKESIADYTIA